MAETKKEVKAGFNKPIEYPASGSLPDYIHEDTLMAKGIAPDSKERVAINLSALKAEYGEKRANEIYRKIALLGKFFDPNQEPSGSAFTPDLSLDGMDKETRAKVDALLNA